MGSNFFMGDLELDHGVTAPQAQLTHHPGITLLPSFQIVSAVQYCHQKFIVHRDLKVRHVLTSYTFWGGLVVFSQASMVEPQ